VRPQFKRSKVFMWSTQNWTTPLKQQLYSFFSLGASNRNNNQRAPTKAAV